MRSFQGNSGIFQSGEIKYIIDNLHQVISRGLDNTDHFPAFLIEGILKQLFSKPVNGIHRCTNLMAHVGHKQFLGPCQFFRFLFRSDKGYLIIVRFPYVSHNDNHHQDNQQGTQESKHRQPAVGFHGQLFSNHCIAADRSGQLLLHLRHQDVEPFPDLMARKCQVRFGSQQTIVLNTILLLNILQIANDLLL